MSVTFGCWWVGRIWHPPMSLSLVPLHQDPSSDQSQTAPPHRANGTEEFQQCCKKKTGRHTKQLLIFTIVSLWHYIDLSLRMHWSISLLSFVQLCRIGSSLSWSCLCQLSLKMNNVQLLWRCANWCPREHPMMHVRGMANMTSSAASQSLSDVSKIIITGITRWCIIQTSSVNNLWGKRHLFKPHTWSLCT